MVEGTYRCVRTTLPNFDGARTSRRGHPTEAIVDAVVELLREAGGGRPVTLVLHDWGCYWGHAAHHRAPELVSRVASLDVAPHYHPTLGAALGIMAYQWWLFGAFTVGGPIGDAMTRAMARAAGAPAPSARIHAWMNYPYRNIWADLVTGRAGKLTRGYYPTCPLLFVYGEKKPFMFHSASWLRHVQKAGGQIAALPVDHWVMKDTSFVRLLERWLARTRPS